MTSKMNCAKYTQLEALNKYIDNLSNQANIQVRRLQVSIHAKQALDLNSMILNGLKVILTKYIAQ